MPVVHKNICRNINIHKIKVNKGILLKKERKCLLNKQGCIYSLFLTLDVISQTPQVLALNSPEW